METLLGAMFVLGAASGLHCVGMCGGVVAAFSQERRILVFNLGRIASYGAGGTIAGTLGSLAGYAGLALSAQTGLLVLANVVLVLVGLHIAGLGNLVRRTEAIGLPLWRRIQPYAIRFSKRNAFLGGLAWGWIPCGLVYGALAAALFAGSPAGGAAAMAAFGLGTLPWLLAAGVAAARLRGHLDKRPVRTALGLAIVGYGAWGLARAADAGELVRQALLCL